MEKSRGFPTEARAWFPVSACTEGIKLLHTWPIGYPQTPSLEGNISFPLEGAEKLAILSYGKNSTHHTGVQSGRPRTLWSPTSQ